MWIDAICINQMDLNERAQQVQLMAEIYRKASLVVVWLGEDALPGLYSDAQAIVALETIRTAAQKSRAGASLLDLQQKRSPADGLVVELLERDWFKRIWVSFGHKTI